MIPNSRAAGNRRSLACEPTRAPYVRLHAHGTAAFSWLYSLLLVDALGLAKAPRFVRPTGWGSLVKAYLAVVDGESARAQPTGIYNAIYLSPRDTSALAGTPPAVDREGSGPRSAMGRTCISADKQETAASSTP